MTDSPLRRQLQAARAQYAELRFPGRLADDLLAPQSAPATGRLWLAAGVTAGLGIAAAWALMVHLRTPGVPATELETLSQPVEVAVVESPAEQATPLSLSELSVPTLPEAPAELQDSWPLQAGAVPTLPSFPAWDGETTGSTSVPRTQEPV